MNIKRIVLSNFRSYKKAEYEFSDKVSVIMGPNASGKTNILEAIYLLSSGKSFRVKSLEREMIKDSEEVGSVMGVVNEGDELAVVITRGEVLGKKVAKKRYMVNGVGKRALDFVGLFRAVYFGPEHLDVINGSPSLRRTFLDEVLTISDYEYRRSSLAYEKGLRSRNRVLQQIKEEFRETMDYNRLNQSRKKLYFWDQLLIKNGNVLTSKREEFINYMNVLFEPVEKGKFLEFKIEYDRSTISEERLKQYENEEIMSGVTLVGPHRDDFTVKEGPGDRDMAAYGSRGEQRLAVLWMKLGELTYIERFTGNKPVLLLDDIFSELDEQHRELVLVMVSNQQTIITTAEEELRDEELLQKEDLKIIPVVT